MHICRGPHQLRPSAIRAEGRMGPKSYQVMIGLYPLPLVTPRG